MNRETKHARIRAAERYGADATSLSMGIVREIKRARKRLKSRRAGKGLEKYKHAPVNKTRLIRAAGRTGPTEEWMVDANGLEYRVIYNPLRNIIVTYLPLDPKRG